MCKSDENALGQVTDRYLGSTAGVIRQKFTYPASANFRLTALQSGVSPNYNNLQNLSYTYDAVGNVKSIVDVVNSSQRQCYNYDALHRLLRGFTTGATTCNNNPNSVGSGPFDETTTYQDVLGGRGGNVTSKSGVGNYTYGAAQTADCPEGALVKANAVVAAGSNYLFYCYDQNGSLRRRKVGSSTTATYGYDAENRLVSVSGAAAATFVYDGDGNRVKTTFGATTTIYVGNTYERDNGSTVRKYYYAGGVRVAMRSGGQTYHLLSDHLGGTNVTANSSGAQISKLLYRPWGETRYSSGSTPTTWRFTGQREDATIGLYYFNARYLDPQLGRFTQPDTIVPEPGNPQALNRYSYVFNNPVRFVDPTGQIPCYGDDPDECSWAGYKDQPAGARRHSLRGYARFLEKQVTVGGMTALDAMIDLWGFAGLYGNEAATTSDDVSYTLVGSGGTLTLLGGFILKGKEYLGGAPLNLPNFGDTGFNPNYQDGHNQPYHFWANVNTTTQSGNLGMGIGLAANIVHEMIDPSEALKSSQERGTSWEDYFLSLRGMQMGQMLHSGALTVDQAGSWMRANLSAPAGPAYDFWESTGTSWWPSSWMQQAVDLVR